jgi:hypothetical protein
VRLAVFGDCTAAGVGATCHEDALAGMARSGVTSRTARDLVPGLVEGSSSAPSRAKALGQITLPVLHRVQGVTW